MLETSRFCASLRKAGRGWAPVATSLAMILGACASPEAIAPPAPGEVKVAAPSPDPVAVQAALALEAKALLAQAETDIQRARAKRALWLKAWEALVLARNAAAGQDHAATGRHARRASELAQLGLEQVAYPAVK